jgi:uncharacterized membrane-anchored protein YhcB (DUF1043 family)
MSFLKTFSRNLILLCTIFVVLIGIETLYEMMESYKEKAVCLEIEDLEDDFDNEVKLKTFFRNEDISLLSDLRKSFKNVYHFNEDLTLDYYSTIFGPPPDRT